MARPPTKQPPEEGAPEWMMTFGDLMSQLLTFFILLISFSMFDEVKYNTVKGALQYSFGIMKGWEQPVVRRVRFAPQRESYPNPKENLVAVAYRIKNRASQSGAGKDVDTDVTKDGLMIRLKQQDEPLVFESGSADIRPEAYPVLDRIIESIADLPNPIEVHGHTDNIPIHTAQFKSNLALSIARASAVVEYFQASGKIPKERLSVSGHGDSKPIDTNDTAKGRANNRRVEILLISIAERPPP